MGKSEIDRLQPSQLSAHIGDGNMDNQPSLYTSNNNESKKAVEDVDEEAEPVELENQVAGHTNDGHNLGMLKYKGAVLKPITKVVNGERESCFYNDLDASYSASLKQLKQFVPQYFGKEVVPIGDKLVECLVLEDLTKGLKEPCIMDIKIGRRTWDPRANLDKIKKEDEKYKETKRDLGFCVPGFQVYKITNGKLKKYGKEYGKKLNKESIIEAFKVFLNGDIAWSRCLLVQLLVNLWRIQNWAKKQTAVRLYSSSILLIYDARRLKQNLEINGCLRQTKPKPPVLKRSASLYRPLSIAILHDKESVRTGFSGQLNADGPIFTNSKPSSPRIINCAPSITRKEVPTLKRMHSFHNNYDKDLQTIRDNYVYMLDDLVSEQKTELWATAKMIDFAHAYPAESNTIDYNYLDGIENLVKIFEGFLSECDNRN